VVVAGEDFEDVPRGDFLPAVELGVFIFERASRRASTQRIRRARRASKVLIHRRLDFTFRRWLRLSAMKVAVIALGVHR
jgi:hypothetical protein